MHPERIREIQDKTTHPDSISVRDALVKLWQETVTDDVHCENCENNSLRLATSNGIINTQTICDTCKFNPQYKSEFVAK